MLQAGVFFHAGVVRGHLKFGRRDGASAWLGWALIAYATVAYPLLGKLAGHEYPGMPMFGITPCPVTIFTFGLLLLATAPVSRRVLAIPFVWSLVGGSAAFLLNVPQDWLLLVSGLVVGPMIVLRDRVHARSESPA